jgi:hypothetical protein
MRLLKANYLSFTTEDLAPYFVLTGVQSMLFLLLFLIFEIHRALFFRQGQKETIEHFLRIGKPQPRWPN